MSTSSQQYCEWPVPCTPREHTHVQGVCTTTAPVIPPPLAQITSSLSLAPVSRPPCALQLPGCKAPRPGPRPSTTHGVVAVAVLVVAVVAVAVCTLVLAVWVPWVVWQAPEVASPGCQVHTHPIPGGISCGPCPPRPNNCSNNSNSSNSSCCNYSNGLSSSKRCRPTCSTNSTSSGCRSRSSCTGTSC